MGKSSEYVLENQKEFDRLENQSAAPAYDFRQELSGVQALFGSKPPRRILDAGCGSGVVSRYLAELHPGSEVVGCDSSELRVQQARKASGQAANLKFDCMSLDALTYSSGSFDFILCRYVLEHLSPDLRRRALHELARCLRPGGTLCAIDVDGLLCNIAPAPERLKTRLEALSKSDRVDLFVGRKIPGLLLDVGLIDVEWEIESLNFRGHLLKTEIELTRERFDLAHDFFVSTFGSEAEALQFKADYLQAMTAPGCVLFYSMFIVAAKKAGPRLIQGD